MDAAPVIAASIRTGTGSSGSLACAGAHARTGDPAMIAGYVGLSDALDDAIVKFAKDYADQAATTTRNLKAIENGRIEVKKMSVFTENRVWNDDRPLDFRAGSKSRDASWGRPRPASDRSS
jgi:Uncharacterized protein conserved in bacteria (DUF2252)